MSTNAAGGDGFALPGQTISSNSIAPVEASKGSSPKIEEEELLKVNEPEPDIKNILSRLDTKTVQSFYLELKGQEPPRLLTRELTFSLTTGLWVLVITLPLWIPKIMEHMPEDLQGGAGWAALIMLFTLGMELGKVLQQVWQALLGIFIAFCNICFVDAVLGGESPSSIGGDIFVWIDYIIMLMVILYLNIGPRAQLLGLHFTSTFIMVILNPDADKDYLEQGRQYLLRSCWGAAGAALAVLLPWPRLAVINCRKKIQLNVENLGAQFVAAHDYFDNDESSALIERWQTDLDEITDAVYALDASLNTAWWEGFDFGHLGQSRGMMLLINDLCKTLVDALYIANVCISEGFRPDHAQNMKDLMIPCKTVLCNSNLLLQALTKHAIDGFITDDEANVLAGKQEAIRKGIQEIAEATQNLSRGEGARTEKFYAWCVTYFADSVIKRIEEIVKCQATPRVSPLEAAKTVLTREWNFEHISFVLWNTTAILCGFCVGKIEFNFSSGIGANVGWLMSKHLGSTFKKDFQRLIGIVVPYTFGGVVYAQSHACTTGNDIFRAFVLYCVEVVCIFLTLVTKDGVFFSPYISLLASVFFPLVIMQSCADSVVAGSIETATYTKIRDVLIAVYILVQLNLLGLALCILVPSLKAERNGWGRFLPEPASEITRVSINQSMRQMCDSLVGFLEQDENFDKCLPGMREQIAKIQSLNKEANGEPRIMKRTWPDGLVRELLKNMRKLRLSIAVLSRVSATKEASGLKNLQNTEAFQKVKTDMEETAAGVAWLVDAVMGYSEGDTRYLTLDREAMRSMEAILRKSELEELPALVQKLYQSHSEANVRAYASVELDDDVTISVMAGALERTMSHFTAIVRAAIRTV